MRNEEPVTSSGSKSRYIPALDGLRAFAVLAVIAYHFGFGWASGGLLGVTVFFVLSGYLITSLLLAEWDRSRTIDLKAFWLRRVKRLFPAIVFLIICLIVLCALFNQELLTKMRPDVPPALFFYSNWWYIFRDVSYFETIGAPSPLTHFWSLAIEEQFYLVWPVLLFILFKRGTTKKSANRITVVLTVLSVLLMFFIYNPNTDPSRVYYGTDTRAFSLLIGAILAFMWPSNQLAKADDLNLSPRVRIAFNGVGIAAFVGLVIMVCFVDGFSPFMYRGGILLASLLTAVVIAILVHPKSILGKIAALPPLVWIGKRSYGMYLWHYPIILLMTPTNYTGDLSIWQILLQLVVIFACSAFSYYFIEDPIRKGALGRFVKGLKNGSVQFASFVQEHLVPSIAGAALVLAALGCFIFVPPVSAVTDVEAIMPDEVSAIPPLEKGDSSNPYNILLIGDSVSVRTIPYFQKVFPEGAIDATVSRALYEGPEVYQNYSEAGLVDDVIVFSLGTNGPAVDEQIDEIVNAVGFDKEIYFVNTRSPQSWVSTTNDTLARAAKKYDNVQVIDWYSRSANHDEYFDGDGTHLNEEGAQVYVEMIREATGFPIPSQTSEDEPSYSTLEELVTAKQEKITESLVSTLHELPRRVEAPEPQEE